jgi:dTDP-4-amino-4,6-dideoxygalactose transaminase
MLTGRRLAKSTGANRRVRGAKNSVSVKLSKSEILRDPRFQVIQGAAAPADTAAAEIRTIPVLRPRLPLAEQLMPYLRQVDTNQIYSNHGPLVLQFERRLIRHFGLPDGCIASASSGTAALVGAILAAAGRATVERPLALMPAYTFVGTATAAEQCGYQPYLADIDESTWMLDPEQLRHLPVCARTGVVMVVSPYGRPVPQAPWARFQQLTGIPVVIDGAACFEAVSAAPEQYFGTIPVALSFHATKSFATAEGGAVVATDPRLVHNAMQALNFGFSGDRNSRVASINGKLSEYHAAIGLAELDGWEDKREALHDVIRSYGRMLDAAGLADRLFGAPDIGGAYGLFLGGREETARIEESLRRHGVDYRLWYGRGLHHQSYYQDLPRAALDVTEDLAPRLLGIPAGRHLTEPMIQRVVAALADGVFA